MLACIQSNPGFIFKLYNKKRTDMQSWIMDQKKKKKRATRDFFPPPKIDLTTFPEQNLQRFPQSNMLEKLKSMKKNILMEEI